MVEHTTFPNAPIVEALYDIRVELPKDFNFELLRDIYSETKNIFPILKEQKFVKGQLKLSPEGTSVGPSTVERRGLLANSSDNKKIVQYRVDGFTFNRLKPYDNWDSFSSEAKALWKKYYQKVKPLKITRIALRYINKIELPLPFSDFKEFILTAPGIAPKLPQGLSSFFMQLTIPSDEFKAMAIVNQTMENPTPNGKLPYIFDIDVYKLTNYTEDISEMWDEFNVLRDFKNKVFFESITEKTAELFK